MFNRRELLLGSISSLFGKFLAPATIRIAMSHLDEFICTETNAELTADVIRQLRWGKAGVISVFSPDMACVLTVRPTEDFAIIWDADTATKLAMLPRAEVGNEESIVFDVTWMERQPAPG